MVPGEGGSCDGRERQAVEASRCAGEQHYLQLTLKFKVRAPFIDGIGAVDRIIERIITGATGQGPTGYEVKSGRYIRRGGSSPCL